MYQFTCCDCITTVTTPLFMISAVTGARALGEEQEHLGAEIL